MASNRPGRLQVGAEIVADVSHLEDLLAEFALVDADGASLRDVRMLGVVRKYTNTHSSCFLNPAKEEV